VADFLGVSLAEERLELAVVSSSGDGCRLAKTAVFEYDHAGASLAERAQKAAEVISSGGFGKASLVVALPGEEVFLQPQQAPFARRGQIARTLEFEMEDKLPFDVSGAVLDFAVAAREGGGSRLIVAAVQRSVLDAVVAPFASRRLKVCAVTADVLAAGGLSKLTGEADAALLEVESAAWKLSMSGGGRLAFARATPSAPREKVEESLAAWTRQSLMAAPPSAAPAHIYISGGSAGAIDVARLGEILGMEVRRLDLGASDKAAKAVGSAGAALAAAACASGALDIEFLRAAAGEERIADALFAPLAVFLVLLAALFGTISWRAWRSAARAEAQLADTRAAEAEIWHSIFPDREPPGGSTYLGLKSAVKELDDARGGKALGQNADWILRALYVLSRSIPDGRHPLFTELTVSSDRLVISVSDRDTSSAHEIADAITEEGAFVARPSEIATGENGETTFKLTIAVKGDGDAE
jgi:hypothetical protein